MIFKILSKKVTQIRRNFGDVRMQGGHQARVEWQEIQSSSLYSK